MQSFQKPLGEKLVFSNEVLLDISTTLQGRPGTRSSWPTQNGLSGSSVNFLFHFALSRQFCLIDFLLVCFDFCEIF